MRRHSKQLQARCERERGFQSAVSELDSQSVSEMLERERDQRISTAAISLTQSLASDRACLVALTKPSFNELSVISVRIGRDHWVVHDGE